MLAQKKLQDKVIKLFRKFQFLLHILIKQILSFVAVKFETYNSFLLKDTVVFIPLGRCAQKEDLVTIMNCTFLCISM